MTNGTVKTYIPDGMGDTLCYCATTVAQTSEEFAATIKAHTCRDLCFNLSKPIKVIFSDPATIVFWADGTKTVVKAHDEKFDLEKGLAMAIAKKAFGNKGSYFNEFKKWIKKGESNE